MTKDKLKYQVTHEWLADDGSLAKIGITSYAAMKLGEINLVTLPKIGTHYNQGDVFATLESTKEVSELYMPVAGKITAINSIVENDAATISDHPFENWIVEIQIDNPEDLKSLLDLNAYENTL